MSDPKSAWMQTFTGKVVWPLDPRASELDIVDIAHALSMMCRYAGHTRRFYSVAEHSVLLARHFAADDDLARWALLHDASEAYLVDVPRPIKPYLFGYREAEAALMRAVVTQFGLLPLSMPPAIAAADTAILGDERAQAMASCPNDWDLPYPPLGVTLMFWSPEEAEAAFLAMFHRLFVGK